LNLIRVMPAKGQDDSMPTSVYLAKLIGPIMLAVGIGIFANGKVYRALAEEALGSRALIYISGVLAMTAGMALVLAHNTWVANWPVLITILGWLAVIGGAIRIICPQGTEKMGRAVLKSPTGLPLAGGVWVVLGLILCFFGYVR
jgi:uncharacterized membrane protein